MPPPPHQQGARRRTLTADRLRSAPKETRGALYRSCYDDLFHRVADHPQVVAKSTGDGRQVDKQLRLLKPLVTTDGVYLEIGAGDCTLAARMCSLVRKCYAVEVSEVIARRSALPQNLELIISDGTSIPVPQGSVDFAYSN